MSRSYKNFAKCSAPAGVKRENKALNSRRVRRVLKLYVDTHHDRDDFLLPVIRDCSCDCGCRSYFCDCGYNVPAINQCEVDYHKDVMSGYTWRLRRYKDGHLDSCRCYYNKSSTYWKAKRK